MESGYNFYTPGYVFCTQTPAEEIFQEVLII